MYGLRKGMYSNVYESMYGYGCGMHTITVDINAHDYRMYVVYIGTYVSDYRMYVVYIHT